MATERTPDARRAISEGIILKGVGGLYTALCDDGASVSCRARGKFRHDGITPLVGDRVEVSLDDKENGECAIERILPRRNSLVRPAVANLTHLFIVVPSAKPKPDLLTVDKIISVSESRDIEPVVIVNKADIAPDEASSIKKIYDTAGLDCILLSAATGDGCDALLDYFKEHSKQSVMTCALAGTSAAGKSTLMKRLFPSLDLKTGEVSRKTERGRHTTRHVELFPVFGDGRCYIADTPGFSLLDFASFNFCTLSELPYAFREFKDAIGKCRYTKCTHTKEEGCAVLEKVREGAVAKERHDNYVILYNEIKKTPEWKRKKMQTFE
ncbi:MAG: ribosome small subunit-dependent GTPase A [Clostridia bacterium]|nr:ribosome small subunit-dependent GTPase A [Clostridia bacterium]